MSGIVINPYAFGAGAPPPTLTRSGTGLIFADTFEDGDVSDWTATGTRTRSATASSPRYGTYALRTAINDATSGYWVYRDFAGHTGNFVAQYWTRTSRVQSSYIQFVDDRSAALAAGATGAGMLALFRNSPQQLQVTDGAGSLANLGAYSTGTWYKVAHVVNVTTDTHDSYYNNTLAQSAKGLRSGLAGVNSVMLGYTGSTPEQQVDLDNLVICTGPSVTCSALPSGHKLRLTSANGSTTAAGTESSGTATVNALALDWPMTKAEVLDGSDNVLAVFNQAVYGGDVFAYSA